MSNNQENTTWTQLVQELKESELKLNQSTLPTYQSRNKRENHYKKIEEFDYIQSRRKKGKK